MFIKRNDKRQNASGKSVNITDRAVKTAEESLYYQKIAESLQLIDLEKEIQKRSACSRSYKSC